MSAVQTRRRPVGVDELQRAWAAVQAGEFRARPAGAARRPRPNVGADRAWAPPEPVLPVLGCVGQAGASTLALAIATAAADAPGHRDIRVVECCTSTASGLACAATAELGTRPSGWALARRDRVLIARAAGVLHGVADVPPPDQVPGPVGLSVLDVGWDLGQVLAGAGWLGEQVTAAETVVAVTSATVPGLRRLENAVTVLGAERVIAAVVGAARRRWPRPLVAAIGPHTASVDRAGRLLSVPVDAALAVRGLDSSPLPRPLLGAATTLLSRLGSAQNHEEGHPS